MQDSGTFRYRVYNICEHINKGNKFSATYFFVSELGSLTNFLSMVSNVVICRVPWEVELDTFIGKVYKHDIKLYFDVDDLIFDPSYASLVMYTLGFSFNEDNYNVWFSYISRIGLTASKCNSYITTNQFIADKMSNFYKKAASVIPNCLNEMQIEVSNQICFSESKKEWEVIDGSKLIGYFSGSPSHNLDFEMIASDLYQVMKTNEHIKLRLVGFLDIPPILHPFLEKGRIERLPFLNYLDLQVKIAECDVNLIPLQINDFTHCKSEIKYFEAGIVKVPSIASKTHIYNKIIENNENGYLENPGLWAETLYKMLSTDIRDVISAAHEYSLSNYYGDSIIEKIENVFSY